LGELGCDWSWLVGDKILKGTEGDILSEEAGEDSTITLLDLSELGGDWSWLISDKVLQSSKGNILTEKR
jgi:hypothetical protein